MMKIVIRGYMIIGLVNQKGGVGKTTLSVCLAYESLLRGNRTLLIDADPQGSIMDWSDKREKELPNKLAIIAMPKKTLHRDLKNVIDGYDMVFIDAPPRTTDITRSTILASNLVVIPSTPSPYDVWATEETIDLVRDGVVYNEKLKYVFTINRKIVNTAVGRDVREAVHSLGEDIHLLTSEVCQRVAFVETATQGLSIQEGDKEGKAKKEIEFLYDEITNYFEV